MPAYNKGSYIKYAIESVINQTYTNWELIIVNDGSTDNTVKEILNFKDRRIKHFNIGNSGVCNARNYGFEKSRKDSNYIYFMDSDDILMPTFIEECITELLKNNAKIVFCDYLEIDEEGKKINTSFKFRNFFLAKNGVQEITEKTKLVTLETLYCNSVINENTTIFDYDCFSSSSKWDPNLVFAEGVNLFFQLILNNRFLFLNKPLYYYRKYDKQTTQILEDFKVEASIKMVYKNLRHASRKSFKSTLKVFLAKVFLLKVKETILKEYLVSNKSLLSLPSSIKLRTKILLYKLTGPPIFWYMIKKLIY
jgi:glycosyltransferase involved in cell wall biosynthesis